MFHRIQFKHSRRQVIAQPNETVLAAAIRAGVQVDYGCNNGHCGQCLARLLHGRVKRVVHSDYVLSASEKQANGFLMCAHAACSDLQLDAHTIDHADLLPQSILARVSRVAHFHQGQVSQLIVRLPRQKRLHFFAGQYVCLSSDNCASTACSIASCPCDISCLEFHVSKQDDSALSRYVFSSARVGDKLMVHGPFGRFTLPEEIENPIVFVGVDLGFAAVKSLLEHLLAQEIDVPIELHRLSASPNSFYLENLCRAWQDAFDNLRYHEMALSNESDLAEAIVAVVADAAGPLDVYLSAGQEVLAAALPPMRSMAGDTIRLHAEPTRLSMLPTEDLQAAR